MNQLPCYDAVAVPDVGVGNGTHTECETCGGGNSTEKLDVTGARALASHGFTCRASSSASSKFLNCAPCKVFGRSWLVVAFRIGNGKQRGYPLAVILSSAVGTTLQSYPGTVRTLESVSATVGNL